MSASPSRQTEGCSTSSPVEATNIVSLYNFLSIADLNWTIRVRHQCQDKRAIVLMLIKRMSNTHQQDCRCIWIRVDIDKDLSVFTAVLWLLRPRQGCRGGSSVRPWRYQHCSELPVANSILITPDTWQGFSETEITNMTGSRRLYLFFHNLLQDRQSNAFSLLKGQLLHMKLKSSDSRTMVEVSTYSRRWCGS
jgi:hypothetical protein